MRSEFIMKNFIDIEGASECVRKALFPLYEEIPVIVVSGASYLTAFGAALIGVLALF
jgi:hypothetical protein